MEILNNFPPKVRKSISFLLLVNTVSVAILHYLQLSFFSFNNFFLKNKYSVVFSLATSFAFESLGDGNNTTMLRLHCTEIEKYKRQVLQCSHLFNKSLEKKYKHAKMYVLNWQVGP